LKIIYQQTKKWLKVNPIGQNITELRGLVDKYSLNTICTSGSCPNMVSVGRKHTMIFRKYTRSCGFCGVKQVALKQWTGMTRKSSTLDKIMNIIMLL
jgi:lipoate synthase